MQVIVNELGLKKKKITTDASLIIAGVAYCCVCRFFLGGGGCVCVFLFFFCILRSTLKTFLFLKVKQNKKIEFFFKKIG